MSDWQVLLETRRFTVVRHEYLAADGTRHVRESVQHPGAVTILPLVDDDHVCLISNERVAVGATLVELPAGTLEPGENPDLAAARELQEETGYRAERIERLATFFMSPGILREEMWLYVATGLVPGAMNLDAGEQIQTLVVSWTEALAMAIDGRIRDAKTLVGLLMWNVRRP